MKKLKVLDLFSGIGGFSLGLEQTGGFETVAFCEIEPFPRKVLAKHWPEVPCYEDVTKLTGDILLGDGISVDVITGGFPCQDISCAGKQAGIGEGTRSGLWSEIVRLIGELSPRYVIVENVAALLGGPSEQRGGWFGRILGDLAECGYDAEWENIPAAALGAPHRRERVWLVAYRSENVRGILKGCKPQEIPWQFGGISWRDWENWICKPSIHRVDDGVSDWPHRLAACGNAVVPQIPELIGRAIMQAEAAL
jgi:DNA (cytosine-5)-methyltransferase 1